MGNVDHKREYATLYKARQGKIAEVAVPRLAFLVVDDQGDPNTTPAYAEAVEALFSVSYTARFALKKAGGTDYTVMPLEGLWWADDPSAFERDDRSEWQWTMMIMQPDCVSEELINASIAAVGQKKDLPALPRLRFENFEEGRCAQVLHVGPFSEEKAAIDSLHEYIEERGKLAGKHHEIYLSDIRRAKPENWKTIIRQPMA